jgi:hypothetical protein
MSIDLPEPIAAYFAAENGHDAGALARCFTEHAVVQDEGRTFKGLADIKQWKAETKRSTSTQSSLLKPFKRTARPSLPIGLPGISPAVRLILSSSSGWKAARLPRWRSIHALVAYATNSAAKRHVDRGAVRVEYVACRHHGPHPAARRLRRRDADFETRQRRARIVAAVLEMEPETALQRHQPHRRLGRGESFGDRHSSI